MEAVTNIIESIVSNHDLGEEDLLNKLKTLRNSCAQGSEIQCLLAGNDKLQDFLKIILYKGLEDNNKVSSQIRYIAWQLLANMTVNNTKAQNLVWMRHSDLILDDCLRPPIGKSQNVQLMLIYNALNAKLIPQGKTLEIITKFWCVLKSERYEEDLEFLHFIYEVFLVNGGRETVRSYEGLGIPEQIEFLDYLANYIRHDNPNGIVHEFLLQHLSKEFKMKSDLLLRELTQKVNEANSRKVYALLKVIAGATGSEKYEKVYVQDHSLFLNVSSLLRCLVDIGKEPTKSIYTPMNKLEEVAPSSNTIPIEFESEISYELKTLLVRSLANLLYKNKTNQGYCLDTNLMPSLLECTNIDARNPLIKEWSILAIRNACIGCPEIQEIVKGLTKVGDAKNDILEELNLEMGSLRIQPNKK